ncbi:ABC transporter substrate-binding protein [Streptomyces cocklensis]|uniref:Carbohydrate ABC transporter substrate-binding protein, family n=1 Tax=Actinacidiphila cocklensis TaxID=887465 RepID=A0A9W4GSI1_9ACTN|nr:ABC transporter substrate-binding protein [Actinacidiphila cocklensis]MDD1059946.1 ABC transporter substrate-binding protein [Actinacidiphila cocklensis]WSX72804.1 ABC transporter substrate-binding protein [Streptomyces sp. NBC_00899]WSX81128.1 ABC transporter substrate-binding protein [Streptomyces sp. NBC_00899]CAG6395904.1 Carbohydrate ABC transporter substrate-binding protein, family [Actinacidiphila cocklensis]
MHHPRRRAFLLALAVTTAVLASACSDPSSDDSGTSSAATASSVNPTARLDGVKLTMWTAQNTVNAPKQVIDAFRKATGASVSVQAIPDLYEQNVPTKLASGDKPDLMFWQPSISTLPFIQPQRNLLTLDGEPWESKLGDTERSLGVIDGKRYAAIVTSPAMLGVYYNKDVFKKAGLTEQDFPTSYDQLLALGHKIVDRTDSAAFYEAGGDKWPMQWQMQVQLTDLKPQWWTDLNHNKVKWTDPAVVAAITKYKDKLLDAGLAQKNYRTGTFTGQADALWNGDVGMALNVTSFQSQLQAKHSTAELDQHIGWFPISNSSNTGMYSPDQTNGVVAFKTGDAKRQDAARQFLAFWLGPDYADYTKTMKIPSVEPAVPSPADLPQSSKAQIAALPTATGVFQAKAIVAPDTHLYLADMIFGKKNPQQVAQAIEDQFAQIAKAQGAPGF